MNLIDEIRSQLRALNIVSYSGGKDSSTVLELVLEAIKGTDKRLMVVTADTLMEIPFYQNYVNENKRQIQKYFDTAGISAEMVTVAPETKNTFWVNTLGKGFPASSQAFKWCTGQLKISPMSKYVKSVTAGVEHCIFLGVRRDESPERAARYKEKAFKPNHYAPILEWSTQDVWTHLLTEPCPWGSHKELVKVYKYASDECVYGVEKNVCIGNARYGCWICPLQKNTQLKLIAHATGDDRYLALKRYKDNFQAMAENWSCRSRIRRNGDEGPGPFLVQMRKELFFALKNLEAETGWELIKPEEQTLIFEYWEKEKDIHNVPMIEELRLF